MYDIISQIINHTWESSSYGNEQQYIYFTACSLVIILTVIFIDLIYRIFRHFWR